MGIYSTFTQDILDSLSEGVFTVDKNFKINSFNKAAEKITGFKREEVIGKICKHILLSERCYTNCPIAYVLENGKPIEDVDNVLKTHNGEEKKIKLNAAIFRNGSGNAVGGLVSFRDLSYLEEIESSINKSTQFHRIIGQSKQMNEIFTLIKEVADTNSSVLITGESGTGKELIANAIHAESDRTNKPYVKVNCSVFPPQLLSSELFGHVRGAFTDARANRIGRFELADKGTIFLDEVAEMPLQMQLQLLRVLQEGTFERVGESVTRRVDVRVIAATNVEIQGFIREGKFREDLFYRLNVIPIFVPPLRDRKDDIPALIRHFMNKLSLTSRKKIYEIDDEAMDAMIGYNWPGNIRELENAIEYAFARSSDSVIHLSKLPPTVKKNSLCKEYNNIEKGDDSERTKILRLLEMHHWKKSIVAKKLKIGRTTLWRKMKILGLYEYDKV